MRRGDSNLLFSDYETDMIPLHYLAILSLDFIFAVSLQAERLELSRLLTSSLKEDMATITSCLRLYLLAFIILILKHFILNYLTYGIIYLFIYFTGFMDLSGIYLTVVADRKHSTIGPNIASNRIKLANSSHIEPYVYNP